MTKDVLISVSGLQQEVNQDEAIEVVSPGKYYNKNGKDYIIYKEYLEGVEGVTNCTIIISQDQINIIKSGANNVHMIFEKMKKSSTLYHTPFGDLQMGFYTTELKVKQKEEEILVNIKYNLDINYAHVSESNIQIKVTSKQP